MDDSYKLMELATEEGIVRAGFFIYETLKKSGPAGLEELATRYIDHFLSFRPMSELDTRVESANFGRAVEILGSNRLIAKLGDKYSLLN